jgi:hypothetical protein
LRLISQGVGTDLAEVGFCVAVHPDLPLLTLFVGVENKSNLLQAQPASTASISLYMDRHGNQRNTPSTLAGISQDVDTDLEEVGFCVAVHPDLALLTSFVGVAHPRPADERVTAH